MTRYPFEQWPLELQEHLYLEHPDGRRLIPTQATAALLGCGASNLREMRRNGKLAATVYRQGNVHYYDMEDVAAAYLTKFPLRIQRPGQAQEDADAEATIKALPFIQRQEAASEAVNLPPETPSETSQEERQVAVIQMENALSLALGQLQEMERAREAERAELRQVLVQQSAGMEAQARTAAAQAETIEAQRAEIERLTKAATEQRQASWWMRLWGVRKDSGI